MNLPTNILADGISPGMIFVIAVAIVIALANVFAKQKQNEALREKLRSQHRPQNTPTRNLSPREQTLLERIQEQLDRGINADKAAARKPPPLPKAKKKPKQQPQRAAPVNPTARTYEAPATAQRHEAITEIVQMVDRNAPRSEAARNVRLMLQPSGIKEAFILSQVLGKPKSMQDE